MLFGQYGKSERTSIGWDCYEPYRDLTALGAMKCALTPEGA